MLADLDELILTCSDPRSRAYIYESVQCYKAGAYRASVVSCWIAVAFDLVDKIKELAATGDKSAQEQMTRFEKIQSSNDISGALSFEKELPDMALNKFEFISHLEYQDLVRLVEDRNRCAHPSKVTDAQVFEASAELARLHISNSVRSILSQPVAQGKAALDRIMQDLDSRYFPAKANDIYAFLSAGPLGRPKESLFRNFIQVMTKTILSVDAPPVRRSRAISSLTAMKKMHPAMWQAEFGKIFQKLVEYIVDEKSLARTVLCMVWQRELGLWDCLPAVQQLRISTFVQNSPSFMLEDFDGLLDLPKEHKLHAAAIERVNKTTFEEIKSIQWMFFVPTVFFERALHFYKQAANFADANDIGRLIRGQITEISEPRAQLDLIIKIAKHNDQVRSSNELVNIFKTFASEKSTGLEFVKERLADFGLEVKNL
ncbi:hypothetical protein [Pseudomonas sp. Marseille-Q5117]|uniref:hypothetical protein n=1 Tax=Pseudomonas sp. Marseille-Q5117 TaxID=2972777 RepID=UPI0021C92C1F|nr:hypothetical protein [Pseudomonas sp. Marseille-Q5117]